MRRGHQRSAAIGFAVAVPVLAFIWLLPLPVPFPGASLLLGALLAFLATLALCCLFPPRWFWRDEELLARAFMTYHNLSPSAAGRSLHAITQAHDRALILRHAAPDLRQDLRDATSQAADRLDAASREIFYDPSRLSQLSTVLTRSALIIDATKAHHAMVARRSKATEATIAKSRDALLKALTALEDAFCESELSVARGQLYEVRASSSVAEGLLRPRATPPDLTSKES